MGTTIHPATDRDFPVLRPMVQPVLVRITHRRTDGVSRFGKVEAARRYALQRLRERGESKHWRSATPPTFWR